MPVSREEFIRRIAADHFWTHMTKAPDDRVPLSRDEANSMLVSCVVNRGIQWERAMSLVDEMKGRTGYGDTVAMFTELTPEMIEWHMFADTGCVDTEGRPLSALHRYRYMAEYCCLAAHRIAKDYSGDVRLIWRDEPTGAEFMRRVCEFKGLAQKCGGLFCRLAVLCHGVALWDNYAGLDVSPDVHVVRVMRRLRLVAEDATPSDVVKKARELSPYAPVEWEGLWLHGVDTCHAVDPECGECALAKCCHSRR